ncbi:MAG: hypothetical protein SV487_04165 [Thermodesulfobacteriota bacterium]|nr:hypothetical protein [Thermodesulfobacteriota bacterium]
MPKRKSVDEEKLIKAVAEGLTSKELMDQFDIKTSGQLKALYLDALAAQGLVTGIAGRTSKAAKEAQKTKELVVNKRGSLIIPREMVDEMGFKVEETFTVRKTKAGISLKKI